MEEKTIDVIIPTYKPGKEFQELLKRLMKQKKAFNKIFLLQTIEDGEKPMESNDPKIEVYPIAKKDFDHGHTRAYGASLSKADYVMFMTQDAMPVDDRLTQELLKGFTIDPTVAIVYGRQLARPDADITEKMTRMHSYPDKSSLKTKADLEQLGIKTYFCSDVCAVYDKKVYDELGGFVYPTIFNEDMIMASKVIQSDHSVYYAADAKVIHSHSYTCKQQFVRNFDLGVSQKQYHEVFENISSEKEGAGYAKELIVTLCKKMHFAKAIYFAWQCGFRLAGYRLGLHYDKLSKKMILRCTMNKGYWDKEV